VINLVVFASGSGTNFEAIVRACDSGLLMNKATVQGLIVDKNGIGAIERAERLGISSRILRPTSFESPKAYARHLINALDDWNADLLILAGYLKKIPNAVLDLYDDRILNIHPSLLPKYGGKGFYGEHVHRAVLAAGDEKTGCTVHLVTEEYDDGPILAQREIPVRSDDTPKSLAHRIHPVEHQLYVEVIDRYIDAKLRPETFFSEAE
jgi:formyltetrahydrofolate-dependent phosphoribosylglycinamide formyltransferase